MQRLDARHTYGRTALFIAAESGFADAVQLLLEAGANPNLPDAGRNGDTAIHVAAYHGYFAVVRSLLDHVRTLLRTPPYICVYIYIYISVCLCNSVCCYVRVCVCAHCICVDMCVRLCEFVCAKNGIH